MQTLEKHITALFRKHDCVIVPDFGGFLLNYRSSRISDNEILPPGKLTGFNRSLTSNDGLLANAIAQREKISYTKARNCGGNFLVQILIHIQ